MELTRVEFRVLQRMLSTPGRYHSRCQLTWVTYEDRRVVSDRTIDSHLGNLRRELPGDPDGGDPIRSRHGIGDGID